MINILSIYLEGFGPYVNGFNFEFESSGLNLIKGHNGVGKTRLFSALAWAFYGSPIQAKSSIESYVHLRGPSYRGTVVDVTFSKGTDMYRVIRFKSFRAKYQDFGMGKERIIFLKNSVEISQVRDKSGANKKIQECLGLSFELFKTSILFGQKVKRLMEEDGPDKKKIFEEAFTLGFINDAKEKAEKEKAKFQMEITPYYKELAVIEYGLNTKAESLKNTQESLERVIESSKQHEVKVKKQKDQIRAQVEELKTELLTFNQKVKKFNPNHKEELLSQQEELSKELYKLDISTRRIKDRIEDGKKRQGLIKKDLENLSITKVCPLCNQKVTPKDIASHTHELTVEFNTLTDSIRTLFGMNSSAKGQLSSIKKQLHEISIRLTKFTKLENQNTRYLYVKNRLKELRESQKSLDELTAPDNSELIPQLEKTIADLTSDLAELKEKNKVTTMVIKKIQRRIDLYAWLIASPLSNSGLKAFLFNYKLEELNARLAYYSKFTGFRPTFQVDMASGRKDIKTLITKGENLSSYEDLSGGEAQLVNIVTAFATHDVIGSNFVNILILDEVFENLDEDNIDVVSELINIKARDRGIYLITHRKEFIAINARVLEFTIEAGVTQRV
jgi:DNA repair exonuclease SbcCD ATPase subunit